MNAMHEIDDVSERSSTGSGLQLPLARYRLTARMHGELRLPDYAGSLLRGVFGAALRRTACMTGLPKCQECPLWRSCPYPALFETPPRPTQLAQRFSQVPNPYVIEPPPLGLRHVEAGGELVFHMVLIGPQALRQLPLVLHAWQRALRHGLGHERVAGEVCAVELIGVDGAAEPVFDAEQQQVLPHEAVLVLGTGRPAAVETLTLHIHTPLRLQHEGHPLDAHALRPRTLLAQLLRRTNLMLDLHLGIRPVPFDARALVAQAETLQDDRRGLRWKDWIRYSSRQQQEMALGGVLGDWVLHGNLAPFLPWLVLGQWLHLGKNATMGMGGYRLGGVVSAALEPPA